MLEELLRKCEEQREIEDQMKQGEDQMKQGEEEEVVKKNKMQKKEEKEEYVVVRLLGQGVDKLGVGMVLAEVNGRVNVKLLRCAKKTRQNVFKFPDLNIIRVFDMDQVLGTLPEEPFFKNASGYFQFKEETESYVANLIEALNDVYRVQLSLM